MTTVIPLKQSTNYNQLKYALRSLVKYHPNTDLIIVGPQVPSWLINAKHIIHHDARFHEWKSQNIYQKCLAAFNEVDEFMFMNDDHILLSEVNYSHHKGKLIDNIKARNPIGTYTVLLQNTYDVFGDVYDFDTHCPIFYGKQQFEKLLCLDWTKPHGYGIKTAYCAANNIEGEYYPDLKFNTVIGDVTGRLYFTIEDDCQLVELKKIFPDKSKFELP